MATIYKDIFLCGPLVIISICTVHVQGTIYMTYIRLELAGEGYPPSIPLDMLKLVGSRPGWRSPYWVAS